MGRILALRWQRHVHRSADYTQSEHGGLDTTFRRCPALRGQRWQHRQSRMGPWPIPAFRFSSKNFTSTIRRLYNEALCPTTSLEPAPALLQVGCECNRDITTIWCKRLAHQLTLANRSKTTSSGAGRMSTVARRLSSEHRRSADRGAVRCAERYRATRPVR